MQDNFLKDLIFLTSMFRPVSSWLCLTIYQRGRQGAAKMPGFHNCFNKMLVKLHERKEKKRPDGFYHIRTSEFITFFSGKF